MEIFTSPFTHGILNNAMDDTILNEALSEMKEIQYNENKNDLYHFKQASVSMLREKKALSKIIDHIYSKEFRNHFSAMNYDLLDQVDISSHCYEQGHYLLCHDDKIEERDSVRKIAFILYFNKDWKESYGGSLDLYKSDSNGQPASITKQILPEYNTLAFFEVSPTSYHQVAMVNADAQRYSLSGWFYVKQTESPKPANIIENWINSCYLNETTQEAVLAEFSNQGYILLKDFLVEEKFKKLKAALVNLDFQRKGPVNICDYSIASSLPPIVQEFQTFFSLFQFKDLLNKLTSLDCRISINDQIRKFNKSQYKLLRDDQLEPCGLDMEFYLATSTCATEYCTMDCELVTIEPIENALSLVYRDAGVMRYVSCNKHNAPRIDFVTTYLPVDGIEDMEMDEDQ